MRVEFLLSYEILNQLEGWFIVGEDGIFPVVVDSVVILECITVFVHEEDARNISLGERVVVAVAVKFMAVQSLEIAFFCIDLVELGETIYFCAGSEKNIKLTTPDDMEIFKALLSLRD